MASISWPSRRFTLAGLKATRRGGFLDRVRIHDSNGDSCAGPLGKELCCPVGTEPRQAELLALLEAQAGLAAQGVAERGSADRDRIEDGRLDDGRRGRRRNLAVGTAHHPGDAQWAGRVGDQQRVRRKGPLDVIERLDLLSVVRGADHDRAAAHGRGVEHVDRLAHLEHHVVARIDGVRHRAQSRGRQAQLDLQTGDGPIFSLST